MPPPRCAPPPPTRTRHTLACRARYIASDMTDELPESIVTEVTKMIPLARFGQPDEVAGLVKYLALDKSALYITGHCLNIDGGIAIGTC